ncbi:hypothetical protein QBC32DRAFT_332653 [Pseudoneurospora amorphoporcata]|uniref:Uncharacterized protein n=1 Tax=Pseudoneurospora amorphoporcata TaxID=241081 RepID=A0AAN6P152_9PEZI|nr:hypothetical protein QBC32DRAFT_332653 [Pseudoneurospora amorphoporcata]
MPTLSLPDLSGGYGTVGIIMIPIGILIATVPGLVLGLIYMIFGFGKQGIVAGSRAAKIQSIMRIVAATSVFAIFQSAAMGGYGAAIVVSAMQAAGVLTAVLGTALAALSAWRP